MVNFFVLLSIFLTVQGQLPRPGPLPLPPRPSGGHLHKLPPLPGFPPNPLKKEFLNLLNNNGPLPLPLPGAGDALKFALKFHPGQGPPIQEFSDIYKFVPKDAFFADMNPIHMAAVKFVSTLLLDEKTPEKFLELAKKLKGDSELHPKLLSTALIVAKYARPDLLDLLTPESGNTTDILPFHYFPDQFVSLQAVEDAITEGQECVVIDENVGADNGQENKLWYFREDVFLNSHHWMWHRAFPTFDLPSKVADRRGELFYYMHQSLMARYKTERIVNGLPPVESLEMNPGYKIGTGYKAHLNQSSSTRPWTDRVDNKTLENLKLEIKLADGSSICDKFPEICISVESLHMYQENIKDLIDTGTFTHINGTEIDLKNNPEAIEHFANLIEATNFSPNPEKYGPFGLHGGAHILISYIMDPNITILTPSGVMGDTSTSVRDPVFYQWHGHIDDLFDQFKQNHQEPYYPKNGMYQLEWPGVKVDKVEVSTDGKTGDLETFWNSVEFYLNYTGTNLNPTMGVPKKTKVCAKHLDHKDFNYKIEVTKDPTVKTTRLATVRIFMAPRFDQNGEKLSLEDQRRLFFPLDRFTTNLADGKNVIVRSSKDTPLTVAWTGALKSLNDPGILNPNPLAGRNSGYCGCGYPHHMMLPKGGKVENGGVTFDLFVMVTNGQDDEVGPARTKEASGEGSCKTAEIYCGIPGAKYPDAKPMGYPWDRKIYQVKPNYGEGGIGAQVQVDIPDLEDYVSRLPNSATTQVKIIHDDTYDAGELIGE